MSLFSKQVLAFFVVGFLTALLVAVSTFFVFQSIFHETINTRVLFRRDSVARRLSTIYAMNGNWSFLESSAIRAEDIIVHLPKLEQSAEQFQPNKYLLNWVLLPDDLSPSSKVIGAWWFILSPFLAIVDTQGRLLAGNADAMNAENPAPIYADENRTTVVGYVYNLPDYSPKAQYSLNFILSQVKALLGIVLLVSTVGAGLGYMFSRYLRAPILALTDGTARIAAGDLQTRIEVTRTDELGALAANFNSMADSLLAYEQMRRQWVADTSHELKTPLATAIANLHALQSGLFPLTQESLEPVAKSIHDLQFLVAELHELASNDARQENLQCCAVELQTVFSELVQRFEDSFVEKNICLSIDEASAHDCIICTDRQKMVQTLSNLLTNSLKYTDSPGRTEVRAILSPQRVVIICDDTPPCPAPEHLDRLFERFFCCDPSRSPRSSGSGIGLALAKEFVVSQGGGISASRSPLGGLRITLLFPREEIFSCQEPGHGG